MHRDTDPTHEHGIPYGHRFYKGRGDLTAPSLEVSQSQSQSRGMVASLSVANMLANGIISPVLSLLCLVLPFSTVGATLVLMIGSEYLSRRMSKAVSYGQLVQPRGVMHGSSV